MEKAFFRLRFGAGEGDYQDEYATVLPKRNLKYSDKIDGEITRIKSENKSSLRAAQKVKKMKIPGRLQRGSDV